MIILTCNLHEILLAKHFIFLFSYQVLGIQYFTLNSTYQFRLATFQVLNSHTWLPYQTSNVQIIPSFMHINLKKKVGFFSFSFLFLIIHDHRKQLKKISTWAWECHSWKFHLCFHISNSNSWVSFFQRTKLFGLLGHSFSPQYQAVSIRFRMLLCLQRKPFCPSFLQPHTSNWKSRSKDIVLQAFVPQRDKACV